MPKYLFEVSYTAEGLKGVLADGGSKRVEVAKSAARSVGGTIDSVYFAFGSTDVFAIADLPDNESAAALSLVIGASGAISSRVVVLLTPEQIDGAVKKQFAYAPPGT